MSGFNEFITVTKTEINEGMKGKKVEREKRKSVVTKFDFSAAGAEMMDLVGIVIITFCSFIISFSFDYSYFDHITSISISN